MSDKYFEKIQEKADNFKKDNEKFLLGEPVKWSDIKEEDYQKEWIWENYIAKGNITLLSALWKAGKTTFLRCLFVAIKEQEEFAGQPTYKSNVLIISEEAAGEWSESKSDLSDEDIKHIYVWSRPTRSKPNTRQWQKLIDEAVEQCKKKKIDMVVIDTLTTFWPIDNENDSAQVAKALIPLYGFTENNIAVLLVHHFRKGGGDQGQASRGSGALPGFVDNIIEFTRSKDGYPNQRTLTTYGRFNDVVPEVLIELNEHGKYETKGEPWKVSKNARLNKILSILDESTVPMATKEILSVATRTMGTINQRTVQRYIKELVDQGLVEECDKRAVAERLVPTYARNGWLNTMRDNDNTLPLRPVVSRNVAVSVADAVAEGSEVEATTATRQVSLQRGENTVAEGITAEYAENNNDIIGDEVIWEK